MKEKPVCKRLYLKMKIYGEQERYHSKIDREEESWLQMTFEDLFGIIKQRASDKAQR